MRDRAFMPRSRTHSRTSPSLSTPRAYLLPTRIQPTACGARGTLTRMRGCVVAEQESLQQLWTLVRECLAEDEHD